MSMELKILQDIKNNWKETSPMPLLFIGHGSPLNAIENNQYHRSWKELGKKLPRPVAILSISAHWITHGTKVTMMQKPKTIHDFGGFPDELYMQQYPAPGSIWLAEKTQLLTTNHPIEPDYEWGLDHGTWSVLLPMFPLADIPVIQLSIDYHQPISYHYELATQLKKLREKGVLIIGSGNIVHNLQAMRMEAGPYDWNLEFDQKIAHWIETGNDRAIIDFQNLGSLARLAHPTYDHFLPLLYVLGLKDKKDRFEFFNEDYEFASMSMRSVVFNQTGS